jgi:hypothetical protein
MVDVPYICPNQRRGNMAAITQTAAPQSGPGDRDERWRRRIRLQAIGSGGLTVGGLVGFAAAAGTPGALSILEVLGALVCLGGVVLYGAAIGDLARYKGRSVVGWVIGGYLLGLAFSGLLPFIILAVSGNERLRRQEREEYQARWEAYQARMRAERAQLQARIDELLREMDRLSHTQHQGSE